MAITVSAMKRKPFNFGTYHATAGGSGIPLTASLLGVLSVYGDDAGAVLTADTKVVRGRMLYTIDQTGASIARGVLGQTTVAAGVDFSGAARVAGAAGLLELLGTHTVGATAFVGAVIGTVDITTAATVTAGGILAGFLAHRTGAGTVTGNEAAFATKYTTTAWTMGLYMPVGTVVSGGRIGDWVGSAATTSGIAFTTALDVYADGQLDIFQVHGASAADLTSAYSAKAGRFRHVANGITINHESYGLIGQMVMKNCTGAHIHAGLMGTFEVNTAATVPSGAGSYLCAAGIVARVGGATITVGATGFLAGVVSMNIATTVTITSGGIHAAFACCKSTTGVTWAEALYIQDALVAIRCYAASDTYAHGIKAVVATPAGVTTHALKIAAGIVAGYIPVYADETF